MNQSIPQFSRANRRVVIPRLLLLAAFSALLIAAIEVSNSARAGALSFVLSSRIPGSAATAQSFYAPEKLVAFTVEPAPAPAISGTRSICPSGCDYATITAAIADIQAQGLGGALVLELASTYVSSSETFPITFTNLTGSNATNTVTLRPAGGAANLSITSASSTATVDLNNSNFVTIDGRDGGAGTNKTLTIQNTDVAGVAIRFINEASNNTVKYAVVAGVNTAATRGVVWFSTTTGANGNDNNTLDNCDIRDGSTTPTNTVYSLGTTTTTAHNNSGNIVSNCNIFNFYAATETDTSGVRLDGGNTNWAIIGNSFYQTISRTGVGSTHPGTTVRGIYVNNLAGTNFTVTSNTIGGSDATAGGSPWTINGTAAIYRFVGIQMNVGVSPPSSVQGNTVKNFSWLSTNLGFDQPNSLWNGIYLGAGSVNVGNTTGNTIGGDTGTGSVLIARASSGADGLSFGIVVQSNGTVLISNNKIGSITTTGSNSASSASLVGIQVTDGTGNCSAFQCGNFTISNNTVGSMTTANSFNSSNASNSSPQAVTGIRSLSQRGASITGNTVANLHNNYAGAASTGFIHGISTSNGANTITANNVRNLSTTSQNSNTTTSQSAFGIVQTSTAATQTTSQNIVHSLSNTSASAAVWVTGIYCAGGFNPNIIQRNFVHSLAVASTGASSAINGIQVAAGPFRVQNNMVRLGLDASGSSTASASFLRGIYDNASSAGQNFYNNSVYIGGNQTTGAANSFAFFSSGSNNLRIFRNNIFFNGRSNAGNATGKPYAAGYGGVGFNPAGLTSNHNIFFVSGAGGVLGIYGGADRITLSAWQSAHGQDSSSAFVDPLFVSPNAGTPDLHLQASNPAESSGIANAFVIDDFDGETRSSLTPTDVGADAGNFTLSSDAFAPVIGYPILSNGSTSNRALIGFATITDNVGVADNPNRPRLYFKKSTDADAFAGNTSADNGWKFVTASNSTSPYDFTIDYSIINGGSVVVGDTIQYFIVAQDAANNLSSNPVGAGSLASPPIQNINVKPVAVNSYNILGSIIGTKTVCAAGPPTCDYVNLTGASGIFADINSKVVAGNLTVNIAGNLTEDGTNGLNHIASNEFPQPTVTIQPGDGTLKNISGNVANGMIRLNGADRVIIDGRFNGAGRFLLFRNTFNSGTSPTISLLNDSSHNTIRNSTIEGANVVTGVVDLASGVTTGNDHNIITDNIIRDRSDAAGLPICLIFSSGTSSAVANTGNTVANNELFNFTSAGILMSASFSGNESWNIQGNTIYQTAVRTTFLRGIDFASNGTNTITQNVIRELNTSNHATGIILGDAFNTTVSRNRIYSFPSTSGSGFFLTGIEFGGGGNGRSVTLVNNQITIIPSFTNNQTIRGIYDNAGPGSTFNAYYNSVLVGGTATGSNPSFACLRGGPPPSTHTLRNNICFNNRTGGTGNHFAAGRNTTTGIFSSNYNLFVGTGSTPANFMAFGDGNAAGIPVSFAQWQAGTGGDANSQAGNPGGNFTTAMFVNPAVGDLHIVPAGNPLVSNTGTPVAGVTTDYDNETRDGATPDIGSDEINVIPPDTTPPNVLFIDDGDADNAVFTNAAMTYTISFNEDIDAATLTAADFDNTGTSTISIGTITETSAQSGVFTVQVTPTSAGTLILRVRSDNVIADAAGNNLANPVTDDSTITVSNAADVQINSLTDSPDPVFDDELITYTIGFINNGPSNASSATVTNAIPANTTFFSASTSSFGWSRTDATPAGGTGNIIFSNPSAPVGVTASFTVAVKVNSGTSTGTFIANTPAAASSTLDPVPSNNSLTTFTQVVQSLALVVNDAGDAPDNNIGNGICDTSAAPGEQCTLRAAIQESNTTADFDSIGFAPALSGTTIVLNSALNLIDSNLSINGPGANLLTVKRSEVAATGFRIFTINAHRAVSISGLTITNGRTADGAPDAGFAPGYGGQGGNGGGIHNEGALTLTNVVVTGNRTGNGGTGSSGTGGFGGFGGGIYSRGTLTMTNVTVSNNITGNGAAGEFGGSGGSGGGVFTFFATANLTNCIISNNLTGGGVSGTGPSLSGGGGGGGGGFYVEHGVVEMKAVVVSHNATGSANVNPGHHGDGGNGAGIIINNANVKIVDSTVSGNHAGDGSGPSGQGGSIGGILHSSGTLTVLNSTISGNITGNGNGGGGSAAGFYNSGNATLTNTTISGNSTVGTGRGGGIFNASNSLTLTNCTITNNSASDGHGMYAFGDYPPANLKNTILANNGGLAGGDASGAFNSQGNNLVSKSDGSTGFTNGVNGDQVGTVASPLDPRLGPLANNGGPTQTHALLAGSPALDAGNNAFVTNPPFTGPPFTDQRVSFTRIADGDGNGTALVDIGAYERQGILIDQVSPPAGRSSGGQQIILAGAFANLSTVTMGGASASWFYTNGNGDTSTITVTTPAHAVGAVQIDLSPTSGSPYSRANAFAYLPTVFTDNTIVVGQTTARAQHIIEMRQAVDALRVVAGLTPAPWTDPSLTPFSTSIKAVHILELRINLDDAAARLGYATSPYTDPSLGTGIMVKRIHIEELRQRIRNIAG